MFGPPNQSLITFTCIELMMQCSSSVLPILYSKVSWQLTCGVPYLTLYGTPQELVTMYFKIGEPSNSSVNLKLIESSSNLLK